MYLPLMRADHAVVMAQPQQQTRRERREAARATRVEAEQRAAADARRRRRLTQLGGALVLAAIVVVVAIVVSSHNASPGAPKPGEKAAGGDLARQEFAGIPQQGSVLGNQNAAHTLVEYGDLVCPACKAYSDQIIPTVIQDYVRTGKLRLEFQPFQFVRPYSQLAAQYAWAAAAQNKMFQFSKVWYTNQGDESVNYVNDAFARKIAAAVPGLDADKLIADSRSAKAKQQADAARQSFDARGLNQTPSFVGGTTGGTLANVDLGGSPDSAKAALDRLIGGQAGD
jgi:protein-disulfide isomerase